jgi:hypothetical protein
VSFLYAMDAEGESHDHDDASFVVAIFRITTTIEYVADRARPAAYPASGAPFKRLVVLGTEILRYDSGARSDARLTLDTRHRGDTKEKTLVKS